MDSKRVINNSIALVAMDLFSKLVPLVTFPYIARTLGPTMYGQVGFAMAVTGFFGLLAAPGFTAFGIRESARGLESPRETASKLMSARIALALFSYALLTLFTFTLAPRDGMQRALILLQGASFLVSTIDLGWLFMGQSRMWRVSLAGMLGQLTYAAVILTMVHSPRDAWFLPVGTCISLLTSASVLLYSARQQFGIGLPHFVPEQWAKFLPVCFILGVASMMSMIYDQLDTVMLRYMRSEAEVGMYTASYRLMSVSLSFMPVIAQVFYPLLSAASVRGSSGERRYMQWMTDASLAFAIPIAAGGFLLAKPIAALVLGAKFAGSDLLLRWLMLNLVSASFAVLGCSGLIPFGRERKYVVAVAAGAATNFILNLIFMPKYGALAAVFTTIAAQTMVACMGFYYTRDLQKPSLKRPLVIVGGAAIAMIATLMLVQRTVQLNVIVQVAIGALVYGGGYLLMQAGWKKFAPPGHTVAAAGE